MSYCRPQRAVAVRAANFVNRVLPCCPSDPQTSIGPSRRAYVLQNVSDVESTREEAAAELWKLALANSGVRMELAKTNYAEVASRLLDTGIPEEQHVSAGLLAVMAADPDASETMFRSAVSARTVNAMNRIFVSESGHDRSKVLLYHAVSCAKTHSCV